MTQNNLRYEIIHHDTAVKKGFQELLDYLLDEAGILLDYWGSEYNDNSVVVQMGNSHVGGHNIFSVWPDRSSRENGLWFGYSEGNYRSAFKQSFPLSVLPKAFLRHPYKQHNNLWYFGWIKNKTEIDLLITACDQA